MNLTANIPIDFNNFEAIRQMIIEAGIAPAKINQLLFTSFRQEEDGPAPMTVEEIELSTIFFKNLIEYCEKRAAGEHIMTEINALLLKQKNGTDPA